MKRIMAFLLLFVMLFSVTAYANETPAEDVVIEENTDEISPRYTYLNVVTAGLEIDSNGHASFDGTATSLNYSVRIKLYLQRSKNQLIWDDIQGTIKTVYSGGVVAEERDLPAEDYFYRAKVVAEVLDSNKNVIESTTVYSSTERY